MDEFVALVSEMLIHIGVPPESIFVSSGLELPGWFRAEKKWDLVVVHSGELLACAEFKSHVGPSFGNNFNNRTEEALGSATDLWAAYREGSFKPAARPWVGYLMLLEDSEGSSNPVSVKEPHFKVFPEYRGASYRQRYEHLILKLVRDRLYDSACLLLSQAQTGIKGVYTEPNVELAFDRFLMSLLGQVLSKISR